MKPWAAYQEEVASFFRSLALDATVDERLQGIRTTHDVDVVVRMKHVGVDVLWLVECKRWASRVSKLHVMALREIASDLGADRALLLSDTGFQVGAIDAASSTNIQLSSLDELRRRAEPDIAAKQITEFRNRVAGFRERYWAMPKEHRIAHGLRPEAPAVGYSAPIVIDALRDALDAASRNAYPIQPNFIAAAVVSRLDFASASAFELINRVEPVVDELERRLSAAERAWLPIQT